MIDHQAAYGSPEGGLMLGWYGIARVKEQKLCSSEAIRAVSKGRRGPMWLAAP